jgi:hypothetical protein
VGCVISGRNYSFDALTKTKECVINNPAANLAEKVVKVGRLQILSVEGIPRRCHILLDPAAFFYIIALP